MAVSRLRRFVEEIANIGRDPRGGWTRLAFSEQERQAHSAFQRWAAELGLVSRTDPLGTTIAEPPGSERRYGSVLIGSHLDTVPQGGNFDGVTGVAAGLEIVRALRNDPAAPSVAVVAFAAEEGARFGMPCLGSRFAAGIDPLERILALRDQSGVTVEEATTQIGLQPRSQPGSVLNLRDYEMFIELHIEQGRVLETRKRQLGIVDVIAGSTRIEIAFSGTADHGGATPMRLRRDALVCASEFVCQADLAARRHPTTVATVGRLDIQPGSITTVPGSARLWLDVRDVDSYWQRELAEILLDDAFKIGARHGVHVHADLIADQSPVLLHRSVRHLLAEAATSLGLPFAVLPSGAGHDAARVAAAIPTGLLFIPCKGGLSHAPAELASFHDIARGAAVIAEALRRSTSKRVAEAPM